MLALLAQPTLREALRLLYLAFLECFVSPFNGACTLISSWKSGVKIDDWGIILSQRVEELWAQNWMKQSEPLFSVKGRPRHSNDSPRYKVTLMLAILTVHKTCADNQIGAIFEHVLREIPIEG